MKTRIISLVLIFVFAAFVNSYAEKYVSKSNKMEVDGTSTLHDWTVPVKTVTANGDITVADNELKAITSLNLEALVKSMKSTKGEGMDEKIYETLKSEDHPKIMYKLTSVKSITKTSTGFDIDAKGSLTIAGSTQNADMTVKAKVLANGEVEFTGSKKLKLSEYGMKRPSAMLGTIKAGDDITVNFTLVMKKG